ncbi:MAG: PilN domain-containing protein [bacterium]|nr:PilN domain-containing protein [bacterium]MDZ4346638.1 PilN domain-containing protein [Candidatus Binatia bacterium]
MAQINLAPGTQYALAARRRRQRLFMLSILVMAVLLIVWGGLFLIERVFKQRLGSDQTALAALETEITRVGPDVSRIQLFEGRVQVLGSLLDNHVNWNPLLQELEKLLPPETVLTSLRAGVDNNTVDISGTTPNIDVVAQTLASLADQPDRPTVFSSGNVKSINRVTDKDEQGNITASYFTFNGTLEIKPSFWQTRGGL